MIVPKMISFYCFNHFTWAILLPIHLYILMMSILHNFFPADGTEFVNEVEIIITE